MEVLPSLQGALEDWGAQNSYLMHRCMERPTSVFLVCLVSEYANLDLIHLLSEEADMAWRVLCLTTTRIYP